MTRSLLHFRSQVLIAHDECPLMAPNGHGRSGRRCPLLGAKRTSRLIASRSASDALRGYLAAPTRFNPTIAGSDPVWTGSALAISGSGARGHVREAGLHLAQEAVKRTDAGRHPGFGRCLMAASRKSRLFTISSRRISCTFDIRSCTSGPHNFSCRLAAGRCILYSWIELVRRR